MVFANQPSKPDPAPNAKVRIGANECWTGPFPVAAEAAFKLVTEGNRYEPDNEHEKLFAAVAQVEGIPADRIVAWPGSSDPLSRVAVGFMLSAVVGIDTFGESAPAGVLFKHFGFTVENVVNTAKSVIA